MCVCTGVFLRIKWPLTPCTPAQWCVCDHRRLHYLCATIETGTSNLDFSTTRISPLFFGLEPLCRWMYFRENLCGMELRILRCAESAEKGRVRGISQPITPECGESAVGGCFCKRYRCKWLGGACAVYQRISPKNSDMFLMNRQIILRGRSRTLRQLPLLSGRKN